MYQTELIAAGLVFLASLPVVRRLTERKRRKPLEKLPEVELKFQGIDYVSLELKELAEACKEAGLSIEDLKEALDTFSPPKATERAKLTDRLNSSPSGWNGWDNHVISGSAYLPDSRRAWNPEQQKWEDPPVSPESDRIQDYFQSKGFSIHVLHKDTEYSSDMLLEQDVVQQGGTFYTAYAIVKSLDAAKQVVETMGLKPGTRPAPSPKKKSLSFDGEDWTEGPEIEDIPNPSPGFSDKRKPGVIYQYRGDDRTLYWTIRQGTTPRHRQWRVAARLEDIKPDANALGKVWQYHHDANLKVTKTVGMDTSTRLQVASLLKKNRHSMLLEDTGGGLHSTSTIPVESILKQEKVGLLSTCYGKPRLNRVETLERLGSLEICVDGGLSYLFYFPTPQGGWQEFRAFSKEHLRKRLLEFKRQRAKYLEEKDLTVGDLRNEDGHTYAWTGTEWVGQREYEAKYAPKEENPWWWLLDEAWQYCIYWDKGKPRFCSFHYHRYKIVLVDKEEKMLWIPDKNGEWVGCVCTDPVRIDAAKRELKRLA